MLREGGEDPRVLQKLDAILAKLDDILAVLHAEIQDRAKHRMQDLVAGDQR
jgi:hypothetical protein